MSHYSTDHRVHIVRVNKSVVNTVQNACIRKGVNFKNYTSDDRLSEDEIKDLFEQPLLQHVVILVKGFFRRANLIPNQWKMRIGATHELYTKKVDNNVQIQGLTGRMTGYWRKEIEMGHKTGPHRTSIDAITQYEANYDDPFGMTSYQTTGFTKKRGIVKKADPTMLSAQHIRNLEPQEMPTTNNPSSVPIVLNVKEEDFKTIRKTDGNSWNMESIFLVIKKYSTATFDKIKDMEKEQVVQPLTDESYKKLIDAFVNAYEENRNYTWAINDQALKQKDTYQIYLDNRCFRIIVSIHFGSRL